jgi:nitroreductase
MTPLAFAPVDADEVQRRASAFQSVMMRRRTVRDYSQRDVPRQVIEAAIAAAATAPSGANLQPWHFVAVSRDDTALRTRIRTDAEAEEREFYAHRAPPEWLEALAPIGTDWRKPFLEVAPWLIAVFVKPFSRHADGRTMKHYYAAESVGIATGFLIAVLHQAGLATLTHTPSPMGFLNALLDRPSHERPFLLLVVGYPAEHAQVPDITRKPLADVLSFK